jgi:hypothetical protein
MSYRYKRGKYVEDSTRGNSKMIPKKYKGDMMIQVWLDSRKLALLSKWIDEVSEVKTRFLSEVVRGTIDAVVDTLTEQGWSLRSFDESRAMLENKYKIDLNPQGRGLKNLRHNRILESMREEEYNQADGNKPVYKQEMPDRDDELSDMLLEGLKRDEEIKSKNKQLIDLETKKSIEAARASGILYDPKKEASAEKAEDKNDGSGDEDKATIVREGMSFEEANARQAKKDKEQEEAMKNMMCFGPAAKP